LSLHIDLPFVESPQCSRIDLVWIDFLHKKTYIILRKKRQFNMVLLWYTFAEDRFVASSPVDFLF